MALFRRDQKGIGSGSNGSISKCMLHHVKLDVNIIINDGLFRICEDTTEESGEPNIKTNIRLRTQHIRVQNLILHSSGKSMRNIMCCFKWSALATSSRCHLDLDIKA
jgi:hypothetical protein